jgi:uncharacterized protein (DUF924 family)
MVREEEDFDLTIRSKFLAIHEAAARSELDAPKKTQQKRSGL